MNAPRWFQRKYIMAVLSLLVYPKRATMNVEGINISSRNMYSSRRLVASETPISPASRSMKLRK